MTKFDTYNRKSYFSALLSIRNLIENSKINMKMHKMNNLDGAIELIQFCIMHIDDFIKYGELLDFCFYATVQQNGKKKTCKCEIISPDDERAKKCVEYTKQELLRPYSYRTIKREFHSLKTQHYCDYLNRFYEEYKEKQLEPEAQNFFDGVCKELIEKEELKNER